MKQGIKNVLIFTTGAAVGSVVTTLALRAFYTKFINETLTEEVNKQIDEIRDEYKASVEEIKAKYEENAAKTEEKSTKCCKNPQNAVQKEEKKKKTREEKQEEATDYTKYSEGKKKGAKKTVKDVRTEAMLEIKNDITNSAGNYIISYGDYTEDNGYEKFTGTYYQGDGVFTNEYDDPDPDLPGIVCDLMKKFDDYGEGNSLFIRSDERETDYEIIFDEGCYGE